jgi:hypothetical protein
MQYQATTIAAFAKPLRVFSFAGLCRTPLFRLEALLEFSEVAFGLFSYFF